METLDHNEQQSYYDNKENFTSQMLQSSHVPWNNVYPETFIGPDRYNFNWSSLTVDQKKSLYNNGISKYRYRENIFDGYVSLHYIWKNTAFIADVRADATNYAGWAPRSTARRRRFPPVLRSRADLTSTRCPRLMSCITSRRM
ncbi:hypothetical protein [Komagataeibacter xylinus]|uniref:hypothetical protein n=1 Tax=Komagataeibacter xylinus TaxID=28448 RepID=UPI001F0EF9B4|nr:hypothetical protein [Komagataeibacter xylinus]